MDSANCSRELAGTICCFRCDNLSVGEKPRHMVPRQDTKKCRIHLHLYVHSETKMRLALDDLKFLGARPYWHDSLHGESLQKVRNPWAAFFYIV